MQRPLHAIFPDEKNVTDQFSALRFDQNIITIYNSAENDEAKKKTKKTKSNKKPKRTEHKTISAIPHD